MKSGKIYSHFYTEIPDFYLLFSTLFKPFSTFFFLQRKVINMLLIISSFYFPTYSFLYKNHPKTSVNNTRDKIDSKSNNNFTKFLDKNLSTVSTAYHQYHEFIFSEKRKKSMCIINWKTRVWKSELVWDRGEALCGMPKRGKQSEEQWVAGWSSSSYQGERA